MTSSVLTILLSIPNITIYFSGDVEAVHDEICWLEAVTASNRGNVLVDV